MRRVTLLILLFLVWGTGCGNRERDKPLPQESTPETIPAGGTLIVGLNGEPDGLNPLFALSVHANEIMSLVFSRLADFQENLHSFTPRLAKSWEWSPDSLSILFHLRTDVRWHDGTSFSARDVRFSYRMQVNREIAWDGVAYKEFIREVTAFDDSTAIFTFTRKYPAMLMDAVEGFIVPAHILETLPPARMQALDFSRSPVGTGPFRFEAWETQQSIILTRFADYFMEGKPYLDRVVFKIVLDNSNLFRQLLSGDVDFISGIAPLDYLRLVQDNKAGRTRIRPIQYLGRNYDFIGWNLYNRDSYKKLQRGTEYSVDQLQQQLRPHPLFGSRKVRTALTMAIDREKIAEVVNHGMAIPMHGPVPPILWAYDEKANQQWPYDPERALRYLREEGWTDSDSDGVLDKNGVKFSFEMLTNSGNARREQALTIIQDQLRQVRIEMRPRVVEPGLLFSRLLPDKDFDAILFGWVVGLKMDLAPLFHSSTIQLPFHFTGYFSQRYDIYETLAKEAASDKMAQKYWDKIAQQLSTDLPYTWLYYRLECSGIHSRFRGTVFDKRGSLINVEDWWIPLEERTETDKWGGG